VFAGAVLWWLLRGSAGPSVLIIREGDALQPAAAKTLRGWFKVDLGFQRVYPSILLGPYAAWVVCWFPLERGRLRLSLPVNLAACAAFMAACGAIDARTRLEIAISVSSVIVTDLR
jgi:hypothetical protein